MSHRWTASCVLGLSLAAAIAGTAGPAHAHAFGQRYDLPVPLELYLFGAGMAVILSFVVMSVFFGDIAWSRRYPRLNLLRYRFGRLLAHPVILFALKLITVFFFVVTVAAGFLGDQTPLRNIAPVLMWIIFWVGMVYVSAFLGDLWSIINPWRTLFSWIEALYRRLGGAGDLSLGLPYPDALGVWPAVAMLLGLAWIELVFPEPAIPANVAWMIVIYSAVTWTGMFLFGRERWLKQGEVFSLFFGVLARFAPFETRVTRPEICKACGLGCLNGEDPCVNCATCFARAPPADREWAVRPFAVGLLRREPVTASMMAFVLLMLSIVLYDGFLVTPAWSLLENTVVAAIAAAPNDLSRLLAKTIGLVGFWCIFFGAYLATCWIMRALIGGHSSTMATARRFALTLIPIAIAYHLAHYLSFLLIQGQYVIPLASDPFGFGWDLFGTAGYRIDIAIVGARFAWYLAVTAIVIGHIVAVYLAHVQALTSFRDRGAAIRSQYAMTALMVAYTVTSLSILAEPIVRSAPAIQATETAASGVITVPEDALLPMLGDGRLASVGPGKTAGARLRYKAMASAFHDGTSTTAADILYTYSFLYRWSNERKKGTDEQENLRYDPAIARATELLREQLVAIKLAGIDRTSKSIRFGDLDLVRELLLVDIYLKDTARNTEMAAMLAAPWSNIPWHLLALMEEAVTRGWASFSAEEAARRSVEWLDLARSETLKQRLASLLETFERQKFVPETLRDMVSPEAAEARWKALRAFHEKHNHFLVTNGPYLLKSWSPEATVLQVFRDKTYPLGVGSYDSYAIPRRAYIAKVEEVKEGLRVAVEIELLEKAMRSYKITRQSLQDAGQGALRGQKLDCHYLVLDTGGEVRLAGRGRLEKDGIFVINFRGKLPPGGYAVLMTLYLNGNTVNPDIRRAELHIPAER